MKLSDAIVASYRDCGTFMANSVQIKSMASELLQLRQRVAEMEWVKVSEGLPIAGKRYWVHMSNDYEVVATYFWSKKAWKNDSGEFVANVTHYMPLPLPPQESEKESEAQE